MRLIVALLGALEIKVSIHASVKDATERRSPAKRPFSFNPRICKRCDFVHRRCGNRTGSFNPRICKRCDLVTDMIKLGIKGFNPRICKRCDKVLRLLLA